VREGLSVRLTSEPLDPGDAWRGAADPSAGAVVVFAGTVRDHSGAGKVTALDYEAWEERALARLEAVGGEMLDGWPVRRAVLWHRTGHLEIGEVSVVVACSAPHRAQAFEAARHGIERIKQDVPIWKKESLVEGEPHWVMGS
jgi:molybdopterin synthase catalytic subunit